MAPITWSVAGVIVLCGIALGAALGDVMSESEEQESPFKHWVKGKMADTHSVSRRSIDNYDSSDLEELDLPSLQRITSRLESAYLENALRDYVQRNAAGGMRKRQSGFWQPMGGPLPVETRFVSFGSRLEPDKPVQTSGAGIKAMRYGRRR